jgi:hypothetical protein
MTSSNRFAFTAFFGVFFAAFFGFMHTSYTSTSAIVSNEAFAVAILCAFASLLSLAVVLFAEPESETRKRSRMRDQHRTAMLRDRNRAAMRSRNRF